MYRSVNPIKLPLARVLNHLLPRGVSGRGGGSIKEKLICSLGFVLESS